jgi:hypothetical protein
MNSYHNVTFVAVIVFEGLPLTGYYSDSLHILDLPLCVYGLDGSCYVFYPSGFQLTPLSSHKLKVQSFPNLIQG